MSAIIVAGIVVSLISSYLYDLSDLLSVAFGAGTGITLYVLLLWGASLYPGRAGTGPDRKYRIP